MNRIQALYELRGLGAMGWSDADQGWIAAPEDVIGALESEGFVGSDGAQATERRGGPPDGAWRGRHPRTGSTAVARWAHRAIVETRAVVFITIDDEALVATTAVRREREDR